MVQVIEEPAEEETPRRASTSAVPNNDTAPNNVTTTSIEPVPFIPGDGSASSITALADEIVPPLPSTPLRPTTPNFGLTPLSAARSRRHRISNRIPHHFNP